MYALKLKYYFIISGLIIFFFMSCEKSVEFNFTPNNKKFLIVDGIITNEYKNQKIYLSESVKTLNQSPALISGAEVSVSDGEKIYLFSEQTPGTYVSDEKFSAVINKPLFLHINFEEKTYTAEARSVPVLSYNSLTLEQYNDTLYYISNQKAEFNPYEAAMYEVSADNYYSPDFESYKGEVKMYFYVLKTIDVGEIFPPRQQLILFPKETKISIKKYSLSPEHEKFIRSLLLEAQWSGGNFDTEKDNVYTNLSEGAFGFFAASNIISDSVILK